MRLLLPWKERHEYATCVALLVEVSCIDMDQLSIDTSSCLEL